MAKENPEEKGANPTQAASEATRQVAGAANEAVRRTVDEGMNFSRQMADTAREGAQQGRAMSRQVVDAWTTSTEATLKAAFDLQNAAISAGRSLIESSGDTNRSLFEQWAGMVRQAQQATLNALQASKRISEQLGGATEEKSEGK